MHVQYRTLMITACRPSSSVLNRPHVPTGQTAVHVGPVDPFLLLLCWGDCGAGRRRRRRPRSTRCPGVDPKPQIDKDSHHHCAQLFEACAKRIEGDESSGEKYCNGYILKYEHFTDLCMAPKLVNLLK